MVEAIVFPKVTLAPNGSVDLHGGVVLPGVALLEHLLGRGERRHQMHVVRHHHEVGEKVSVVVKEPQAVCHDDCQIGPPQNTRSVAIVQGGLPADCEAAVKLVAIGGQQSGKVSTPLVVQRVDAVS